MSARNDKDETGRAITLDRAYFRAQAHDAMKTFFSPLAGVFEAIRSDPVEIRDEASLRR